MVKFGGKIGTLYQMLKNAFKKHPLQNRTNVQIKGGGVKGLLNNVQKNCTFLKRRLPLVLIHLLSDHFKTLQVEPSHVASSQLWTSLAAACVSSGGFPNLV